MPPPNASNAPMIRPALTGPLQASPCPTRGVSLRSLRAMRQTHGLQETVEMLPPQLPAHLTLVVEVGVRQDQALIIGRDDPTAAHQAVLTDRCGHMVGRVAHRRTPRRAEPLRHRGLLT